VAGEQQVRRSSGASDEDVFQFLAETQIQGTRLLRQPRAAVGQVDVVAFDVGRTGRPVCGDDDMRPHGPVARLSVRVSIPANAGGFNNGTGPCP